MFSDICYNGICDFTNRLCYSTDKSTCFCKYLTERMKFVFCCSGESSYLTSLLSESALLYPHRGMQLLIFIPRADEAQDYPGVMLAVVICQKCLGCPLRNTGCIDYRTQYFNVRSNHCHS